MKCIKHNLGKFEEIRILPLADLHLGDTNSDFKKLMEYINFIKDNDNVFTILNGDLMDSATRYSVGDVYGQTLSPMEQLKQCVKLFEPIAPKILAVTPGNHEQRINRNDGISMTDLMCAQLGIPERHTSTAALLFIRFGEDEARCHHKRPVLYTIYCVHGAGGGRMEGGKVNRLMQLGNIVDADIFLHSHSHLPAIVKTGYYRVSAANSSAHKVDKLFVNTAALLNYGGYGELQSYKPTSIEMPMIILDGTKHDMKAVL